ncbi:DUF1801 domain-containing protein [Aureibaculum sp. 2210JD6-5]|uniref:DUF1801 domain-containing protein n=1 Tax=Aureibaculum sp. 2210JD6-5 TaxID=3103957 RepID=UPI002AAD2FC0|nr:DUF1801 domain-containing protein [Aureibaculum sp. 2210JD6-5]MDY7394727.1 DUF1801 domain-containing protein [Aureibaculum sp. 2210JD6-5]
MNPAENYILNQPEPYRSILLHLQVIIENTIKDVDLKYKYRIPFYYINGRPFCYLNVNQKERFVDLGFWNAAHLTVNLEYMTTAKRKMMKSLRYKSLKEINEKILIEILKDAYAVKDKKFYK